MDADLGILVDFLRGELDAAQAAVVRARLENEDKLFQLFERLRRTYAVLRSMPLVGNRESGIGNRDNALSQFPDTDSRFPEALRSAFESRGLVSLIPYITARPQYLSALRVEFSVRAICASLPQLAASASLLAALRAEFAGRALLDSLPFIKARPEWIGALRREFAARAVVAGIPLITPRPEFVAALRAEFAQRALAASLPVMEVRAGFERRLKVALVEASREAAPAAAQASALPAAAIPSVQASDPFRRRLFRKILVNSHRRVRETPKRVDLDEYKLGRELKVGLKQGRRSIALTFAMHTLAIVVMLFVFINHDVEGLQPYIARGESDSVVAPPLPGAEPEWGREGNREVVKYPRAPHGDWSPLGEDLAIGMGGEEVPDRERRTEEQEFETPPPERKTAIEQVLGFSDKASVSSFFRLRGASRPEKVAYLGSEELYAALDKALAWLARQQQMNPDNDGSWAHVNVDAKFISPDVDLREIQKLEMTCAAVLAFLGDGHSSLESPIPEYAIAVKRGVAWILNKQRPTGQIGPEGKGNVLVHAMATLALAEEFGMTRQAHLREPLRAACRWLCDVKAADSAGFPFLLTQEASMSTSVWAYMALATARNVKVPPIDLPQQRIDEFLQWYESQTLGTTVLRDEVVLGKELLADTAASAMSQFAQESNYVERQDTLLSKISREMPNLKAPANLERDNGDVRFLFFGSLAQSLNLQRNGRKSSEWYGAFTKTLLQNQVQGGAWSAETSKYSLLYGDAYATAMASLSIENAYRVSILSK